MKWRRRRFQRARKKAREATWKTFRAPAVAKVREPRWPWKHPRKEIVGALGEALQQDECESALAALNDPLQGPYL